MHSIISVQLPNKIYFSRLFHWVVVLIQKYQAGELFPCYESSSNSSIYLKTLLSYLVFLYQPIPIITSPIIITTVRRMESGESRQDTIIPVPAPVKKSMIDFSFLFFPILFLYLLSLPSLNSSTK